MGTSCRADTIVLFTFIKHFTAKLFFFRSFYAQGGIVHSKGEVIDKIHKFFNSIGMNLNMLYFFTCQCVVQKRH